MTDWSLRLAHADDADEMPAIEAAAAQLFAGIDGLETIDPDDTWEPSELRGFIRKGHCLVAHVGEQMAGFLINQPFGKELHIWEMDVLPDFQQRGIGAGLLRACQIDARNSGFRALTLTTFVDLPWNRPFYARLGFERVEELAAHPRLNAALEEEAEWGLPRDRRCAMIHFLQ
ncbi:MAG: GNAT family N-acetyltransferase [Erythrobacter sp.]